MNGTKKRAVIIRAAEEHDVEMMLADGFDDCIIGVVGRFGKQPVVLYDRVAIIRKLMKDMSVEEAEEFFEFNIAGAWVGEGTPAFMTSIEDMEKLT